MRLRHIAIVVVLALFWSAPGFAHGPGEPSPSLPPADVLGGSVRDSDISLLFDYLRSAVVAAAEGREPPPPPPELGRRAEKIGGELRARGALAAVLLLSVLEDRARRALGESPPKRSPLPPTVPYTQVSD